MMSKFKVGDKVLFNTSKGYVPSYKTESDRIDSGLIKHGNTNWDGSVSEVIAISNGYVVVRYSGEDKTMQLGFNEFDLKLVEKSNYKPLNPTHLVVWEEDRDPCKFFESEDKAKEFIKELSEKSNVTKDSIVLVEIKSARKIKIQKSLRYLKYTI